MDFDEWIVASFGEGIADVFMRPYNFKVWAYPPHELAANWVGERVATINENDVLRNIKAKTDLGIVILGTDQDNINNLISEKNKSVINLSGKTNLRQAMSILSLSESVFGSDTGLLHIAEALGKTANMILGPTSKETGGGVSLKISNNIEKDIWCRPCSQNGKNLCYRSKQYCMDLISPSTVSNAVIKSS